MDFKVIDLQRVVKLLQSANNKRYALLPEIAREFGKVKKTDILEFITANPKLFYTENIWSYRDKTVRRRLFPNSKETYKDTVQVKSRNLGLGVISVYLTAADNWRTEEWIEAQKVAQARYLHVTEMDNYGHIYGYQILPDGIDNDLRYGHWRNTTAKLDQIKDMLKPGTWYIGGFGDSSSGKAKNCISADDLEKLKSEGWKFNDYKPLNG